MTKSIAHKTYPVMLLGTIGAVLGMGILLYDYDSTPSSQAFASTPEFTIWLFLIVAEMILFAIFPIPLMRDLRHLRQYLASNRADIALSSVMLSLLFWLPILVMGYVWTPVSQFPLAYHRAKMIVILVIGFVTTALPAAIGIWLIRAGLRVTFQKIQPSDTHVRQYLQFRERLQRFVLILGIVVGLAKLGTGAARKALIAWGVSTDVYPASFVLAYGAYFTMLIALVYIPTYSSLLEIGRHLRDTFFPTLLLNTSDWADTYAKRKKLEELLQLQTTVQQSLQASVAIFAPLLSGIISFVLE